MSVLDDDECILKLDTNIDVDTVVHNRFEEAEIADDVSQDEDESTRSHSGSSDEDRASEESAGTTEAKDGDTIAGSDVSDYTSIVSDDSLDSTSVPMDVSEECGPSTSKAETDNAPVYRLKDVSCKELIVFCIDMSSDMEKVPFIITDEFDEKEEKESYRREKGCPFLRPSTSAAADDDVGGESSQNVKQTKHTPLSMVKRAISMFVHNKHFLDKKHEFSLMVLYDTAAWVCDFTREPEKIIEVLQDLTETLECDTCDLSSIVSAIAAKYSSIITMDTQLADTHRIIRIILLYGRSNCMVEFSDPSDLEIIMNYQNLFMDILYVHEPSSEENKCKEIYETLCSFDTREKSYIFEVTRSVTNLHNSMGKLLSHPYQRPLQKHANYRLQDIVPQ